MPAEGGPEVRILDELFLPAGAEVVQDGVYFVTPAEPAAKVRFLDLRSGRLRDIATLSGSSSTSPRAVG